MNADARGLKHEELTGSIIKTFYEVYNELGHGFLESVYKSAMAMALTSAGMNVDGKSSIQVWFRGESVGEFFPDLLVAGVAILELKAVRTLEKAHEAQLLNYLRATDVEVGILFNFGPEPQFKRLVFDNGRKKTRNQPLPALIRGNPRLSAAKIIFSKIPSAAGLSTERRMCRRG